MTKTVADRGLEVKAFVPSKPKKRKIQKLYKRNNNYPAYNSVNWCKG